MKAWHNVDLSKSLPFLIIFVAVMISVRTIIVKEGFVFKDDMAFPFDRGQVRESLTNRFSVWYGKIGGGFMPTMPSSIPFWSIYNLLALGFEADVVNKIVVVMPLVLAGFFMYIFSRRLISISGSLVAAFLYVFNPWVFDRFLSGHLNLITGYAILPIALMFALKSHEEASPRNTILGGLALGLTLTFTMHMFGLAVFLVALYVIFTAVSARKLRRNWVLNIVFMFTLAIILNSHWLLPTLTHYEFVKTSMIAPALEGHTIETINSRMIMINAVRLTGYWLPYFRNVIGDLGSFSSIWVLSSFFVPALAFVAPLISKEKKVIFFAGSAVLFLIPTIVASSYPSVYLELINYFPPLALYRDSNKFIAVLCFAYSILIGNLIDALLCERSKIKYDSGSFVHTRAHRKGVKTFLQWLALSLVLTSALVFCLPNIVSGDFMGRIQVATPPTYWFEVKNFLAQDKSSDWRVMWVPPLPELQYDWSSVGSTDPVDEYLTDYYAPSLKTSNPFMKDYLESIIRAIYGEEGDRDLAKMLAPLSVRYIVLRLDALYRWNVDLYPPSRLLGFFERQQNLVKVFGSGKWIVFRNDYANAFISTTPSDALESVLFNNSEDRTTLTRHTVDLTEYMNQNVSFERLSQTRYAVNVYATSPFLLSLSEAYDPHWVAFCKGERIESIPIDSLINGFYINRTGFLEITIEYEEQNWFYYGSGVSVVTLSGCMIFLAYRPLKGLFFRRARKSTHEVRGKRKFSFP